MKHRIATPVLTTLVLCSIASVAHSQETGLVKSGAIPDRFSISYSVVSNDLRSPIMRSSQVASHKMFIDGQVHDGKLPQSAANQINSEYEHANSKLMRPIVYKLQISSDGSNLLCDLKPMTAGVFGERIGIYSSNDDKTYYIEKTEAGPQIHVVKGFNYTAMACMPLLDFNASKLGLFLIKDPTSNAAASTNLVSGSANNSGEITGVSPYTIDHAGVSQQAAQIPYFPSQITLLNGQPSKCIIYHPADHSLLSEWQFSQYATTTSLSRTLPRHMSYQLYDDYHLDNTLKGLPSREYQYTLLEASQAPVPSKWFSPDAWVADASTVGVSEMSLRTPIIFGFKPSTSTMLDAEMKTLEPKGSNNPTVTPPIALSAGSFVAAIGWIAYRRKSSSQVNAKS